MKVAIGFGAFESEFVLAGKSKPITDGFQSLIKFIVTSIMLAYLLWWLREWIPMYQF